MAAADEADALPVAKLHGGKDVGHFEAEHGDLVLEVEKRRRAQPDAIGQKIAISRSRPA